MPSHHLADGGSLPPLRIGVLGVARVVSPALVQASALLPGVEIVAVASRRFEKARAFADATGISRSYGSYAELLADRDVDAVYIALPPALHHRWTIAALQARKHVLCEKPLATNAALAAEMVECARRCGRVLMEGLHLQYSPALARQREIIQGGELGAVTRIDSCFRFPDVALARDDFRLCFELGGGAGLDLGCYAVACLRCLAAAEPDVVSAVAQCDVADVDSWMSAQVKLPSGAEGSIECGFRGSYSRRFGVSVTCERGRLEWQRGGLACTRDGHTTWEALPRRSTYERQLDVFVRRARGERDDRSPADDAVATARVVDAMYCRAGLAIRPGGRAQPQAMT